MKTALIGIPLAAVFAAGTPEARSAEEIRVESRDGAVVATATPVPKFPQKVTPLSAAEVKKFEAPGLVRSYLGDVAKPALPDYDRAFKAWLDSGQKKHSAENVVQIFGAHLGQTMVDDLQMEWVRVEDQYGIDVAVRHPKSGLLSFPFSSAQKRVDSRETGFMHGVYQMAKHSLQSDAKQKKKG